MIAYDNSTYSNQTGTTSRSFSHTTSGTDRILFVGIRHADNNTISNVAYNGTAMTFVSSIGIAGNAETLRLYVLVNPTSGANNVTFGASVSGSASYTVAVSYTGAKQTSQPDATGSASATTSPLSVSVTTVEDQCWAITFGINGNYNVMSSNANLTTRQAINTIYVGDSNGFITPAGSYTMTVNTGGGNTRLLAASFSPDALAPTANTTDFFHMM